MASVTIETIHETQYRMGQRFRLWAFVCGQTCVRRMDGDPPPTATFQQIYQQRPADCRYAVTSLWLEGRDWFGVFDLFDVKVAPQTNDVETPKARLVHHDLEAAIMATVMLYNKEAKRC